MMMALCDVELAAATARLARWSSALPDAQRVRMTASSTNAVGTCEAKLEAVEAAATTVRAAVGANSCAKRRRGPTGGYCVSKSKPARGGNSCLSAPFAERLARKAFVGPLVHVLDLGAGLGQYGTLWQTHPNTKHIRYIGVDGAENIAEATNGHVRFVDLTDGLPRDVRALPRVDWAMSLEVAEHVPRSGEARYMHALTSLPQTGVIITWATPGQAGGGGGARHVNCQWSSYVDCVMGFLGYDYDAELVASLGKHRKNSTYPCQWLRVNLMAFRRRPREDWLHKQLNEPDVPRLRALLGGPVASAEFEALYLNLSSTRCEYADGYRACNCVARTRWGQICPTCAQVSPREPRTGPNCAACDECARVNRPLRNANSTERLAI